MNHRALADIIAGLATAIANGPAPLQPDEHDFGFPREIVDEPPPEPPCADKGAASYTADALEDFNWHHTIEGPDYWRDVHARLIRIAEDGRAHRSQSVVGEGAVRMTELPSTDDLARAMFVALWHGCSDALIVGDPIEANWWEGELLMGVTIDGKFDMRRAAEWLLGYLHNPNGAVVIPPGEHTLYEPVADASVAFLLEQLWRSGIRAAVAKRGVAE